MIADRRTRGNFDRPRVSTAERRRGYDMITAQGSVVTRVTAPVFGRRYAARQRPRGRLPKYAPPKYPSAVNPDRTRGVIVARMSSRNLLFCLAGLVLGFSVGFFLANQIVPAGARTAVEATEPAASQSPTTAAPGSAGPIDPSQTGGQLPPGHPDISNVASDGSPADPNGVAATNADAQKAMEEADAKTGDFKLQMRAAETFYRLKAYDKAALYLDRAIKLRPRDAAALALAGNAKYDAGDFAAAASFYERALQVEPNNADVRADLGNTYSQRQPPDLRRAVEEYRKAVKANPRHEIALQNMASLAVRLGDKAAAREAVEQLAAANPSNPALPAFRSAVEAIP